MVWDFLRSVTIKHSSFYLKLKFVFCIQLAKNKNDLDLTKCTLSESISLGWVSWCILVGRQLLPAIDILYPWHRWSLGRWWARMTPSTCRTQTTHLRRNSRMPTWNCVDCERIFWHCSIFHRLLVRARHLLLQRRPRMLLGFVPWGRGSRDVILCQLLRVSWGDGRKK